MQVLIAKGGLQVAFTIRRLTIAVKIPLSKLISVCGWELFILKAKTTSDVSLIRCKDAPFFWFVAILSSAERKRCVVVTKWRAAGIEGTRTLPTFAAFKRLPSEVSIVRV
jgi:hypothetical protein